MVAAVKRNLGVEIEKYLQNQADNCGALLLSGARQVGKTTLIKNTLKGKDAIIINLYEQTTLPRHIDATESFEEFERLLLREFNFKPSQGTVLVFDEAQEAKRIGRWIGFFKEKWVGQKVIISGSILSNLFEDGVAYPVGRVDEFTLRPFTFKEFLVATKNHGLKEILEETTLQKPLSDADTKSFVKIYLAYLQTGGMPDIAINVANGLIQPFEGWDRLLRQYALDVERHMDEVYKTMFVSALDRIADITCHPIKNSQIISTDSPSYRKLPQLLEVAEKWHLVHRVPLQTKHSESAGGAASKRYVFDVGLANFFINQSSPVEWRERSDIGNLVYPKLQENFVCQELIATNPRPTTTLSYYRENRNSREVDFVFRFANRVVPLEVKSQSSISRNGLIPMANFLEQRNFEVGVLVYNGKMTEIKFHNKTIIAIPPFLVGELPRMLAK